MSKRKKSCQGCGFEFFDIKIHRCLKRTAQKRRNKRLQVNNNNNHFEQHQQQVNNDNEYDNHDQDIDDAVVFSSPYRALQERNTIKIVIPLNCWIECKQKK
ncbi:hypothetical protein DFA_02380 [Cavenderia fasciculata]|uniref:Uncharacterized protein n=1 Tax=Cavenderia fasciculata TaxID=261658 RepID=F4PZA4_CACFS|nr:uncharacterized protein DFA_02380 [Cavenderia fasciculata]EGG19133.1 hypothetical protein DFA_02380 [Cavenderia fasciculata]|eukprot:XP_004366766.1 hypothetical protein DFA_02380 [Cavenderia fasciculata]